MPLAYEDLVPLERQVPVVPLHVLDVRGVDEVAQQVEGAVDEGRGIEVGVHRDHVDDVHLKPDARVIDGVEELANVLRLVEEAVVERFDEESSVLQVQPVHDAEHDLAQFGLVGVGEHDGVGA